MNETKRIGILHQLLAVEPILKTEANNVTLEVSKRLGQTNRFKGVVTTLKHFNEADSTLDDVTQKPIDDTVAELLDKLLAPMSRAWDATVQKEVTNQTAMADVAFGHIRLNNMPATALLALEARLKTLKALLENVPKLPVGREWRVAKDSARAIYVASMPDKRIRTEKRSIPLELAAASDRHPAQVQLVTKDVPIGQFTDTHTCGMLSEADYTAMMRRLEEVTIAVSAARQKANITMVKDVHVGNPILDYILNGTGGD